MTKQFKKIIKPMYLFFDYLYENTDLIQANLQDYLEKDQPILKYCVINLEDDAATLPTSYAIMFNSKQEAHEYLIEDEEYQLENGIYIWK